MICRRGSVFYFFFFSSRRRHTRLQGDWSSDVCSSDLLEAKEDSEGLIVLSKDKADKIKVWDAITQAYEKAQPVEGRMVEVVKGGLAVDVGVKAFLPGSQVDLRPVKNLASMVGQLIRAKVIKLNRRRGNVVLSRRSVLEEEREEKKKHTLEVLNEGMVLTGTVKNITDYG